MGFGNADEIDRRHRERIRELERILDFLITTLMDSTALTQSEKEERIREGQRVLGKARSTTFVPSPGAYC